MSDLKKPLYTLTVEEFITLTERTIRQVMQDNGLGNAKPEEPVDECMTIPQCAAFLNCSLVSIHNYKKQGLPYYRVGRKVLFKKSEVLAFMRNQMKGKRNFV